VTWKFGAPVAKRRPKVTDTKLAEVGVHRNVRMTLRVNGEATELLFAPYKTLLEVLREDLDLTGTKHGCELGECGACAVLVDGQPLLSCLVLAIECEGKAIETVEGLARGPALHPLQAAFADLGGAQCGYCTPGILMTAKALLDDDPEPSRERIKEAISGNLCRCTGYQQIYESIEEAARRMRGTAAQGTGCGGGTGVEP
jgi:carbon-monoxide dehydrogenase small subunit